MELSNVNDEESSKRDMLEKLALQEVCPCQYYDLADYIDTMSDHNLLAIINQNYDCEVCGLSGKQKGHEL